MWAKSTVPVPPRASLHRQPRLFGAFHGAGRRKCVASSSTARSPGSWAMGILVANDVAGLVPDVKIPTIRVTGWSPSVHVSGRGARGRGRSGGRCGTGARAA